jgi:hypothetical protein
MTERYRPGNTACSQRSDQTTSGGCGGLRRPGRSHSTEFGHYQRLAEQRPVRSGRCIYQVFTIGPEDHLSLPHRRPRADHVEQVRLERGVRHASGLVDPESVSGIGGRMPVRRHEVLYGPRSPLPRSTPLERSSPRPGTSPRKSQPVRLRRRATPRSRETRWAERPRERRGTAATPRRTPLGWLLRLGRGRRRTPVACAHHHLDPPSSQCSPGASPAGRPHRPPAAAGVVPMTVRTRAPGGHWGVVAARKRGKAGRRRTRTRTDRGGRIARRRLTA